MLRTLAPIGLLVAFLWGLPCGLARADDVTPPPPKPYFGVADINGDITLDLTDFRLFVAAWMQYQADQTLDTRADLEHSGAIGHQDAMLFVEEWLKAGP